ncbi:MAG: oligosaccharide flippase family protein [Ignavibacteriales bacterium]|nr:oligosaccharide flippase family protein [Ignavibacteriales bacterium]
MLARLKSTVRDTLIYSLSNIAPKIVGVVLLPLYTAKLALGEFGNWDLIDVTITILAEIFILGQATSIILFNNSDEYKSKKKSALFTLTTFVFVICAIFVLFSEAFTSFFPALFVNAQIHASYIRLIAYIVLLRVLNNLFLAKVRADEQSIFFTLVSVSKILLMTGIIIYLVGFLDKGIEGYLYAVVIAEFFGLVVLLPKIIPQMKIKFETQILSASMKFGLPLVFAAVGFLLLNLSDRYIIKFLLGSSALAPYSLAYRVAGVLNMFFILPFTLGLMPVAYKYFGSHDDKRFFSKLMTYSTFFFVWGFVFLSLFCKEILGVFAAKQEYNNAYILIPVILLSYVFSGMRLTASLGMLLTKNTKHIAWITIGSASLNIILNFIFIPMFGTIAAAMNTLVAFIIFYLVTLTISGKYYKIPFENYKLTLMVTMGSILSGIIYFLPAMSIPLGIIIKLVLVGLFPFLLFFFRFYEKAELEILLSPTKIIDFIKGTIKGADKSQADSETIIT